MIVSSVWASAKRIEYQIFSLQCNRKSVDKSHMDRWEAQVEPSMALSLNLSASKKWAKSKDTQIIKESVHLC